MVMFALRNLGDVFFWLSGLGNFCFFVFVVKWFVHLFRKGEK